MELGDLKALQQAYSTVFSSKEGQLVLEDLQRRCCINKSTIDSNPAIMGYNEGGRSVVLYIQEQLKFNLKKQEELKDDRQP